LCARQIFTKHHRNTFATLPSRAAPRRVSEIGNVISGRSGLVLVISTSVYARSTRLLHLSFHPRPATLAFVCLRDRFWEAAREEVRLLADIVFVDARNVVPSDITYFWKLSPPWSRTLAHSSSSWPPRLSPLPWEQLAFAPFRKHRKADKSKTQIVKNSY